MLGEPNKYIGSNEANILRDIMIKSKKERRGTVIFKNFSDLCKTIGIGKVGTNSKATVLKELKQYVDIRQQRGKLSYRLYSVYDKPKPKVVAQTENGKLLDEILLNLCALSTSLESTAPLDGYDIELSITGFLKELNLLGDKFFEYRNSVKNYSERLKEFDSELVGEILGIYYTKNKGMIEQALKRQSNCCNIRYKIDTKILMFDDTSHYASSEEERFILETESRVLKDMGYNSKKQIVINNTYNEFSGRVRLKTCKKGIKSYFKVHKIVASEEFSKLIDTRANILTKEHTVKECCVQSILDLLQLKAIEKKESVKYSFGTCAESFLLNPNLISDAKEIIDIATIVH